MASKRGVWAFRASTIDRVRTAPSRRSCSKVGDALLYHVAGHCVVDVLRTECLGDLNVLLSLGDTASRGPAVPMVECGNTHPRLSLADAAERAQSGTGPVPLKGASFRRVLPAYAATAGPFDVQTEQRGPVRPVTPADRVEALTDDCADRGLPRGNSMRCDLFRGGFSLASRRKPTPAR